MPAPTQAAQQTDRPSLSAKASSRKPSHQKSKSRPNSVSMSSVPPSVEDGKACGECGEKFLTERMLHMHDRVQHKRLPSHLCPHCGGPYGRATDLNAHILADHDRENLPHKCEECVCNFATLFSLRQHVQTAHRRKLLKCVDCDFETVHQGVLCRHEEVNHEKKAEKSEGEGGKEGKELSYQEKRERAIGYFVVPKGV